ncbi:hypothetical protein BHE74_00034285 [Ensete ventricosum]|nr:hypothetical protein BHE74_00034285 [Ensete ventricosum]
MTDRQQSRRGCPRCLLQAKHVSIGVAEGWEHVFLTCDKNPWMPLHDDSRRAPSLLTWKAAATVLPPTEGRTAPRRLPLFFISFTACGLFRPTYALTTARLLSLSLPLWCKDDH